MIKMTKVDTIFNQLSDKLADDRGLIELLNNGYEDDMKKMYSPIITGDVFTPRYIFKEISDFSTAKKLISIQTGYWADGRLYDADSLTAYVYDDGIYIIYDENLETFMY